MDGSMTICVECKHHANTGEGGDSDWWHRHICGAASRTTMRDPVTGVEGWTITNDLGQVHFSLEEYPHCREKNHGNCPDYEAEA